MSHWQFEPLKDLPPLEESLEMTCPRCLRPMAKGDVGLEYTFWGFFFAGWSYLTLFFRASGRRRMPVVSPLATKDAFACDSCGTIVIVGSGAADALCLSCNATIPAGSTTCTRCGWSYRS